MNRRELKSGSFYYFEPTVKPSGPHWMRLEVILRRIPHELIKEKDGKVSAVLYRGNQEEVESVCARIERFC